MKTQFIRIFLFQSLDQIVSRCRCIWGLSEKSKIYCIQVLIYAEWICWVKNSKDNKLKLIEDKYLAATRHS